jgi:hypothetical protein
LAETNKRRGDKVVRDKNVLKNRMSGGKGFGSLLEAKSLVIQKQSEEDACCQVPNED